MEKDVNDVNEIKQKIAELQKEVQKLPPKAQDAIYWVIENFDLVEEMCKDSHMTDEKLQTYKEYAREADDYLMLALACLTKLYGNKQDSAGQ